MLPLIGGVMGGLRHSVASVGTSNRRDSIWQTNLPAAVLAIFMIIPMNTLHVALEVEPSAVALTAAINWAKECTSGLLLDLL
jgi:hypothetical protein